MKLLVTGREGQLARSLAERAPIAGVEIAFVGRPELDLAATDGIAETVRTAIAKERPAALISAAAWTAVDAAEDDEALAMAVNGIAPGILAAEAARAGIPVIHISTDYVFDGSADRPLTPDRPVGPIGAYGRTKEAGERAVREAAAHHVILRTAWVTSPFGANFVKTMLRLAESRDTLGVVADQYGSPTSALALADAVIACARVLIGDVGLSGTYHVAGKGDTSWAGLARAVFETSAAAGGPTATVSPITTADLPTKAARPANSRLDCTAFEHRFGHTLPGWREAQDEIVRRLLAGDAVT